MGYAMNRIVPSEIALRTDWRVGRKLGRTIYAQWGDEPADSDSLLGVMDDAQVAIAIVALHNEWLADGMQ